MPKVTINITGQGPILADLNKRSGVELNKTILKATRAGAVVAARAMAAVAPIRVGGNADTLLSIKIRKNKKYPKLGYNIGPRIWYRHFVIGGTSRGVERNPWVARGIDASDGTVRAAFMAVVALDIKR